MSTISTTAKSATKAPKEKVFSRSEKYSTVSKRDEETFVTEEKVPMSKQKVNMDKVKKASKILEEQYREEAEKFAAFSDQNPLSPQAEIERKQREKELRSRISKLFHD